MLSASFNVGLIFLYFFSVHCSILLHKLECFIGISATEINSFLMGEQ